MAESGNSILTVSDGDRPCRRPSHPQADRCRLPSAIRAWRRDWRDQKRPPVSGQIPQSNVSSLVMEPSVGTVFLSVQQKECNLESESVGPLCSDDSRAESPTVPSSNVLYTTTETALARHSPTAERLCELSTSVPEGSTSSLAVETTCNVSACVPAAVRPSRKYGLMPRRYMDLHW